MVYSKTSEKKTNYDFETDFRSWPKVRQDLK